jgi:hypothetical protein
MSMVGFVDDSTGRTNLHMHPDERLQDLIRHTGDDAQLWNDLLYTSGGLLEITKCSYHIIRYVFDSTGRPRMDAKVHNPSMTVADPHGIATPVTFLSTSTSHDTLGHTKAPDDNNRAQLAAILKKATRLSRDFSLAPIDESTAFQFYQSIFNKSVGYTLPQSTITSTQLQTLQQKVLPRIFSKCGYNRNTSRAILFGPALLGGAGFEQLHLIAHSGRLQHFIRFWRTPTSDIGQTLRIAVAWEQMIAGTSWSIFSRHDLSIPYLESKWILQIREALIDLQGTLQLDNTYTTFPQRRRDEHLMDIAIQSMCFSDKELALLNYCRLYLRVTLVSDISNAQGTHINPEVWWGDRSTLPKPTSTYPRQSRPEAKSWIQWRSLLRLITHMSDLQVITGTLLHPLGEWQHSELHRKWPALYDRRHFCYVLRDGVYWQYALRRNTLQFYHGVPQPGWHPTPHRHVPVDVLSVNDSLTVISHLPAPLISSPSIHIAETFPDFIDTLPPWENELLQFVALRLSPFALLHHLSNQLEEAVLAVSDGSHVHDRIAFGWTIRDHTGLEVANSHGPGWGQGSSHRAEGYGFLSVILFITRLSEFCNWQRPLAFHFFSDNSGLLSRVKKRISYGDILYPNETLKPDWDIVEQIAAFIGESIHDRSCKRPSRR